METYICYAVIIIWFMYELWTSRNLCNKLNKKWYCFTCLFSSLFHVTWKRLRCGQAVSRVQIPVVYLSGHWVERGVNCRRGQICVILYDIILSKFRSSVLQGKSVMSHFGAAQQCCCTSRRSVFKSCVSVTGYLSLHVNLSGMSPASCQMTAGTDSSADPLTLWGHQ